MSDISHFELRSPSNFFVLSRRIAFVPWYGDLIDLDVWSIRHDSEKHRFLSWTTKCTTSGLSSWPLTIRSSVSRLGWGCRWTFASTLTGQKLRRIQESIQVLRRDDLMSGRCRECRDSVRVSVRSHRTSTTSPVRQISSKEDISYPRRRYARDTSDETVPCTQLVRQLRLSILHGGTDRRRVPGDNYGSEEQGGQLNGDHFARCRRPVAHTHVSDWEEEHGQACGSIPPELSRGARQTQSCT